jgi:NitT/TauT family transport system ATP-binding protein
MQEELLTILSNTRKTVVFVTHDVQESLLLADRVAVMSARPGRIKQIIDISDLGRGGERMRSPNFNAQVERLWGLVRDEALRAQGTNLSGRTDT